MKKFNIEKVLYIVLVCLAIAYTTTLIRGNMVAEEKMRSDIEFNRVYIERVGKW